MRGTVLSVIRNNKGIYGFIKSETKNYYYDTSGLAQGMFIKKGLEVEFEVIEQFDGRERAHNIHASNTNDYLNKELLSNSQIERVLKILNGATEKKGFVVSATIPFILKEAGIDNFRRYSNSVEEFINEFFSHDYGFIKNCVLGEKHYPSVVARRDWTESELPQEIIEKTKKCGSELSEEIIKELHNEIKEICASDGFLLSSAFPFVLRKFKIENYKAYADSIEDFLKKYYPEEYTVLKDVTVNEKRYPQIIVPTDKIDEFIVTQKNDDKSVEEIVCLLEKQIDVAIASNGYLLMSILPAMFKEVGLSNYHKYAGSLREFIQKYFSQKYIIRHDYWNNGKVMPDVILRNINNEENNGTFANNEIEFPLEYDVLNDYYNRGKYFEYLKSKELSSIPLDNLPFIYQEKTLYCAYELLYSDTDEEFSLNMFQRELISNRTGKDFIKKWKNADGYPNTILATYENSSIYHLMLPEDIGNMTKLINNVGSDTKINNSFASLTSRFESCGDSLVYLLYLIRSCSASTQKSIERVVVEYCNFLKKLKASNIQSKIDFDNELKIFERYLRIVVSSITTETISMGTCTNIISVYLDLKYPERITEIINMICLDKDSPLFLLTDFIDNYDLWDDAKYSSLFSTGINLQLIEKICAFIWERDSSNNKLSISLLKILAKILFFSNNSVLDEILRIHTISEYNKRQKEIALLNSFHIVVGELYQDDVWFLLASYIIRFVYNNTNEEVLNNINQSDKKEISKWMEISNEFFSAKIKKYAPLCKDNENKYLSLFKLFSNEEDKKIHLQKNYNDWYVEYHSWYENSTKEQLENYMDEVFEKNADYAFVFIFEYAQQKQIQISYKYAKMYIESTLQMRMYDKIIRFVRQTEMLSHDEKEKALIRVVNENFVRYGLAKEAFLIFSEEFSIKDAISILQKNFHANSFSQIASLIILYAHNNELIKSIYLYAIYHGHAEIGLTRLYSQFRSAYGKFFAKLHNHYDVILKAFAALPYEELLEFLEWTSLIVIPNFSEYIPDRSPFSHFFDELIVASDDVSIWKNFLLHLYKHRNIEANQWLICVCATIARHRFGAPSFGELRDIIIDTFDSGNTGKWPESLLYYAARFIVDNDDEILCKKVYSAISNSSMAEWFLNENPWCHNMPERLDFFVEFCTSKLRDTSDLIYFNMLTIIKSELSGRDLVELSSYSVNKLFLLNRMCRYYIENKNQNESLALLSDNSIWENLTFQENEILSAVKMIHMSTEDIIEKEPKLFKNEEQIARFKKDVALILADFPSQDELHNFDKTCEDYAHKFRVYSVIYGAFGNEDYGEKEYAYNYDELQEMNIEYEYLAFLKKCFTAQLFYNSSYEYFYKLWRYYRLLIIITWDERDLFDDAELMKVMIRYQHHDMAMRLGYLEFKDSLQRFIRTQDITDSEKKCILFSMIRQDFGILCEKYYDVFLRLNDDTKDLLKRMTAHLDYRDINKSLFEFYVIDLIQGNLNFAEVASGCLSTSFSNLLNILSQSIEYENDIKIIEKLMTKSPSACVNYIISLNNEEYKSKCELYNSIIGVKQFAFKVFDRIRVSIIKRTLKTNMVYAERFENLAYYLGDLGYSAAVAQFKHILSLEYALRGDIKELRTLVADKNVFIGIPIEWEKEKDRLIEYALTECEEKFEPEISIVYIGAGQTGKRKLSFVKELCEVSDVIPLESTSYDMALEIYHGYNEDDIDLREKVIAGLQVLQYIEDHYFDKKRGELPEYHNFAFEIGILIASEGSFIQSDKKLSVIIELYQNCNLSSRQKQMIFERFLSFYKELAIELWIKYYRPISEIVTSVGDFDGGEEIVNLCENIIELVPGLVDVYSCSTEDLYDQLKNTYFIGQSVYSIAITRAVEKKKMQIENGVRLEVVIENANQLISDGCLYFCIQNIGSVSVDLLKNSKISIEIKPMFGKPYTPFTVGITGITGLRPNWMTGGKADISSVYNSREMGDKLNVQIDVWIKDILICRKQEILILSESINMKSLPEPTRNKYYVDEAVGINENELKIYGRDDEKEDLKYKISKGKAVIYGPSRIGKTSLLNWVIYSYAKSLGNIISVPVGKAKNQGTAADYKKHFMDNSPVPYDNNKAMAEYLLIDMLLYGLTERRRGAQLPFGVELGNNGNLSDIIDILKQENRSIVDRYYDIDYLLEDKGYEIWILFDEFQEIVENWNSVEMEEPDDFIEVCDCINGREIKNIKLIFCGSDELLRQMILVKNNSVWRKKIFSSDTGIGIGSIKKAKDGQDDEFLEMIKKDNAVLLPGLHYSDAALETLCIYTNRVPLYAKEICNTVLEEIKEAGIRRFNRNYIYSYDISAATQKLVDIQNDGLMHDLDEAHKERIVKIYDDVTKGLEENTDKQYLWLMAQWFMEDSSREVFDYKKYAQEEGYRFLEGSSVKDRLDVACVRGIIRGSENKGYMFSTPFYYNAFCGTVDGLKRDNILIKDPQINLDKQQSEEELVSASYASEKRRDSLDEIWSGFETLSDEKRIAAIGMLYNALNDKEKKGVSIGNQHYEHHEHHEHYGDNVQGSKIGTQNNVQINAQTISAAFNTLLNPEETVENISSAFESLPTLNAYFSKENRDEIQKKSAVLLKDYALYEECFNKEGECINNVLSEEIEDRIIRNEAELEAYSISAEKEMMSDTMGAVVNSDAFMNVNEEQWGELLHISMKDVSKLKTLPTELSAPLSFAIVLHNVFDNVYKHILEKESKDESETSVVSADNMDFCPVAIMYCKIVEAMLKKYHTPLYIRGLGEKFIRQGGRVTFSDLGTPEEFDNNNKELSIGTYVSQIVFLPKRKILWEPTFEKPSTHDFQFGTKVFNNRIVDFDENIKRLINDEDMEDIEVGLWKVHARALKIINEIRNRSAHEAAAISKEHFDWLIEILFEKGELLRIWELSQK